MPTNILDKNTGDQLTAAEFNTVKNLVDTNEVQAAAANATAATNASNISTNTTNIATNTASIATNATAAANALNRANHTGTQTASTISDLAATITSNATVAANTAKTGVPSTTGNAGFLYNSATNGITLSYLEGVNEWLDATADAALITALGSATFTNNVATVSGWTASRKHIDGSYFYVANVADTVTRIALGSGTDAVSLQGRNVSTTAPADGQSLVWNNGSSVWEPQTISGSGGGNTFDESVFRVFNSADNTKQMRMDLGAISTGQTRQLVFPDSDVDLSNVRTAAELITDIDAELGSTNWQSGGVAGTNLGWAAATGTVTSSTGGSAVLTLADGTNRGLMSNTDFTKLAGIESNATADQTGAEIVTLLDTQLGGSGWQSGGSGSTDLTWTASTRTVASSSGNDAVITLATTSDAGLMSAADKTTLNDTIQINGTGLVAGDIIYYDGTEFVRDVSAVASAQTTFTLGYKGSIYTASVASAYTITASGLAAGQSAIALITNATEPTFTLSGGTVTKVGWSTNWDASNQNHVTFVAVSSTLVYAYLSGAEA